MSVLLMAAVLTADPQAVETYTSVGQATAELAGDMRTGSLIFSKGECLAVKIYTLSSYTHVATVVVEEGEVYVYDSSNGNGVRRHLLAGYLESQGDEVLHIAHPAARFTSAQARVFTEHLEAQLGRPYAIKHYVTGGRSEGLHCSEYVTDALITCNIMTARQPSRVSPASLSKGIIQAGLYTDANAISLIEPAREEEQGGNWCRRLWVDTKNCTAGCYKTMRGWVVCR